MLMLHTYLNISDLSDYITDNAYLVSNLLQTSVKESIILFSLLILFQYKFTWFYFIFNYSITDHMASYNFHETLDSISEDSSIPRVVICFP